MRGGGEVPDTWHLLERFILSDFQQHSIPFLKREPKGDFQWLVTGQHYGLPTRLLDWTSNPLTATFFAVAENSEEDGAVFGIEPTVLIPRLEDNEELSGDDPLWIVYPNAIDVRVIAQQSVFTVFPLLDDRSIVMPLEDVEAYGDYYHGLVKMVIPSKAKREMRYELHKLGINHASLFPGLAGLSDHIHWKCTRPN